MELGPTLSEFYSPTTTSERKKQLENSLHAFKALPNAHNSSLEIIVATYLATSHESLPRWVFTKLGKALVDVGKTAWPHDDPNFMTDLQQMASNPSTRVAGLELLSLTCEEFVRPDSPLPHARKKELKASLVWAMPNVLHVLAEVVANAQEAASSGRGAADATVASAREAILAGARCLLVIVSWAPLTEHLTIELFRSLFGVIEAAARGAGETGQADASTPSLQECGATCVACVTEVVSKRLLPPGQQDMILDMADHMLALLKIVTSGGSIRPGLDESFLMEMTEFLGAFMEANLGRVLGMGASPGSPVAGGNGSQKTRGPYPIAELLSLLAAFTFSQPRTEGLQRCLVAWSAFVAQATIEEGEGSAADVERSAALARENAGGLQSVCRALLEKSLFVTNGPGLDELDDEGEEGDGAGGSGSSSSTDGDNDWEQEDGGAAGKQAAAGGSVSELKVKDLISVVERESVRTHEFVAEVRDVLLASSRVPGVGAALSENVLGAFSTVLEQLGSASSSTPPPASPTPSSTTSATAALQARRLAADAATLCALMPVTAAAAAEEGAAGGSGGGGGGLILRAGQAVVEAAGAMATAGLHGRGPEFASLQAAALGAISSLLPGLAGGAVAGDGGDAQATAIAEAVVSLVRQCWDGGAATSGPVPAAAGRLFLSLTSVLPPSALSGSAAVASLLKDTSQVASVLPVDARVLLYRGLSAFLMPPRLLEGDMARVLFLCLVGDYRDPGGALTHDVHMNLCSEVNDLEGRSRAYAEMVAPLVGPFTAAVAGWRSWAEQAPWPGFLDAGVSAEVSSACRILSTLCRSFSSTPAKARKVLYQALQPCLGPLVALVPPTLQTAAASQNSKEVASMARALLRLQVAVVDCLGQEAGQEFASQAVTSLSLPSPAPANNMAGGGGPAWLSAAVFRLLKSVMRARNASTKALMPQACALALERLHDLGRETAAAGQQMGWGDRWVEAPVMEALPSFLDLSRELLVTQWHCFVPSAAARGIGASIADAITAQHAGVRQQRTNTPNITTTTTADFASATMGRHFEGLMEILRLLLSALPTTAVATGSTVGAAGARVIQEQHMSVPPDVVRRALSVLEEAHKGRGLFRFPPYSSVWLPVMLTDAVKGLTEGLHPLMKEEVGLLVFNMAEVDHRAFATEFLPHFLSSHYAWLGAGEREALLAPWRAGAHLDAPTFASYLEAFVSDLAFFRAQADAA